MNIIQELRKMEILARQLEVPGYAEMYNRWADTLEHSGALVPVPYGEPCERRKCATRFFQWCGKIYRTDGHYMPSSVVTGDAGMMGWDDIVQPVRLELLKDTEL